MEEVTARLTCETCMLQRQLRRVGMLLELVVKVRDAPPKRGPDVREPCMIFCLLEQRERSAREPFQFVD
jgi:hypothetical protein